MSEAAFLRVMEFVLEQETGGDPRGGYSNREADRGGETRWGISKRANPDVDVRNLDREGALAIYRERYWGRIRGALLPEPVALCVMDFAVISGPPRAVATLQRELGTRPDGRIGPKTLAALRAYGPPRQLAQAVLTRRIRFHTSDIRRNPSQVANLGGWWRRTVELAVEIEHA